MLKITLSKKQKKPQKPYVCVPVNAFNKIGRSAPGAWMLSCAW